jgi:Flp pilus assembly protein TadB/Mg-chelatase subunit ChlD
VTAVSAMRWAIGRGRRSAAAGAVLAGLLGLLVAGLPGPAAADDQPAGRVGAVRANADRVEFVFSATNVPAGTTLNPSQLGVTLDGTPVRATARLSQRHATATDPLPPRLVMVVLDTSGSAAGGGLAAERKAALDFARRLPPDVLVGLMTFADTPRVALAPTRDRTRLAAALSRITARGGTALYDAVAAAAAGMRAAGAPAGAVLRSVVLSDGIDSSSRLSLADSLLVLRRARVPTDVVAFRFSGNQQALREVAAASGGRVLPAADARGLAAAFTAAAGTLDQRLDVTAEVPAALAGRKIRLEARVRAGSLTLRAGTELTLPAAPAAAAGDGENGTTLAARLVPATPDWVRWVVFGLAFLGLLGLGLLVLPLALRPDERPTARLERYRLAPAAPAAAGEVRSPVARAVLSWVDRMVTARGVQQTVALELDRAGVALRVQEWMLLRACGCAGLAAALVVFTRSPLIGILAGVLVGWLGSRVYLLVRASRRCAAFAAQLPDVLQLVAGSLKSGFSLAQALDAVVRDGSQPAAGEVGRALAAARLGVQLEDALDTVATRMRSRDLSWTVMAIRIQREVGSNLADVLLTTVHTMRERFQVRRQVRALTAEGRLSAYILIALPIAVGGWLFLTRREYMRALYTEPIGVVMLIIAAGLIVVGSFWMSRLVKVEV